MNEHIQVTVTGGSGFIGSHCILLLLEKGYKVTTTIRNLDREAAVRQFLHENVEFPDSQLDFVQADLNSDTNWDVATRNSTFVWHVASPFFVGIPKDPEKEMIIPAKEGALRVLRASLKNKVKRVVLTSSMAAISYGHPSPKQEERLDEDTWTDVNGNGLTPYIISKTLAERAAWEFMQSQARDKMELVCINPSVVLGPVLEKDYGSSAQVIKKIMNREIPALPKMGFQIVDVRDVAQAHLQAMLTPEAAGKRVIVSSGFVWLSELAKILAEEFEPQGYKIPQITIPHFLVRLFSLFDQETRSVLNELGIKRELNNARMQNLLGIHPIATKDAILATAHTLISKGLINGHPKKK